LHALKTQTNFLTHFFLVITFFFVGGKNSCNFFFLTFFLHTLVSFLSNFCCDDFIMLNFQKMFVFSSNYNISAFLHHFTFSSFFLREDTKEKDMVI